jgi:ribosomal protein L10
VKLAALPSREVLLSQLIGTFIAPMSTFLGAINAMLATPANMADALGREKSKAS